MVQCTQAPTAKMAMALASEALSSFYAGEIDRVELVYTSFISMIASVQSRPEYPGVKSYWLI